MQLSANVGYLWADLALPDAVRRAKAADFDAVECHWPYAIDPEKLQRTLEDTGLPLISLNTEKGKTFGRCALDADQARRDIDQAVGYAVEAGARAVHVMAGVSQQAGAFECFESSVAFACEAAAKEGLTILIEPLNSLDVPGYVLGSFEAAEQLLDRVNAPNLKIMLDCYHAGRMGQDPARLYSRLGGKVGHIQFANVTDRGAPDRAILAILRALHEAGWTAPIGAEYRPFGPTEHSLGWMKEIRR